MSNPDLTSARFDPAYSVVEALGGITVAARLLRVEPSTVLRWTMSRAVGGGGGAIPARRWDDVIRAARRRGYTLTREQLAEAPVLVARRATDLSSVAS